MPSVSVQRWPERALQPGTFLSRDAVEAWPDDRDAGTESSSLMDTHDASPTFSGDTTGMAAMAQDPNASLAAEVVGDASAPQAKYQRLVDAEVVEVGEGMCMVASRRAVEATFKNSEVFSSEG